MIRIGLTGGIGSGKTTVAQLFAELGVPVLDADQVARTVVQPGTTGLRRLEHALGPEIVTGEGRLDRAALRKKIFADSKQREVVEQILHPMIAKELERKAEEFDAPYLILVIPLLIENRRFFTMEDGENPVDRTLVVDAPEQIQVRRVMERDQITATEVKAILKTQASREERLQRADDLILNDDTSSLPEQVERLHRHYLALSETGDESL